MHKVITNKFNQTVQLFNKKYLNYTIFHAELEKVMLYFWVLLQYLKILVIIL